MSVSDSEFSSILLHNLLRNEHYAAKVLPYLEGIYFTDSTERAICEAALAFNAKYNKVPQPKELVIEMKEMPNISSLDTNVVNDIFGNHGYEVTSQDWLIDNTEKFIRRRRVSHAFESTYGKFEQNGELDSITNVFQEALAFNFDASVGHDFLADRTLRYDMYTSDEDRLSFGLAMLDKVTNGGMPVGTLNTFLAGTGVGKSLAMCSLAAGHALSGKKEAYISLEMAELRIAERLEANLMDVPLNDMKKLSKAEFTVRQDIYANKMEESGGNIIFKQYPTSSAHAGHFRNYLIECKNKVGIEFDIIYIDYLNICATSRGSGSDNSYTKIKDIAEELRALAVEFQVPIITATQTNRGGQSKSELSFEDVSESHGLAATVDCLFGLISNEEFEKTNKLMIAQIKNRYGDTGYYNKFMVGIERAKMRLYDIAEEASNELNNNQVSKAQSGANEAFEGLDMTVLGGKKKPTNNLSGLMV